MNKLLSSSRPGWLKWMVPVAARAALLVGAACFLGLLHFALRPDARPVDQGAVLAEDEMSVRDLAELQNGAIVVDVRRLEDFRRRHIPGAMHLDFERFDVSVAPILERWAVDPSLPIVVYCDSEGCGRSREVVERMRADYGLESSWVLKGGWEAWKERFDSDASARDQGE